MMQVNSTIYSALLIEDDRLVIDMARSAAAEFCHELDLAVLEGVDAALDWLKGGAVDNGQLPHIILIDLKLPKLDGLALLRTIRNYPATQNVPIVVFSPEQTQDDVVLGYRAGANTFVAKPADENQFAALLREQLAYWMRYRPGKASTVPMGDAAGRI
jgi:DNA-binding response OmpR family regulator